MSTFQSLPPTGNLKKMPVYRMLEDSSVDLPAITGHPCVSPTTDRGHLLSSLGALAEPWLCSVQSDSFREESNVVSETEDPHKKTLDELKHLIEEAIKNNEFALPPPAIPTGEEPATPRSQALGKVEEEAAEVLIWGVPLLGDERSDTVLLKFLRARKFKVKAALEMIKKTVRWRKQYKVDEILAKDLSGKGFEKAVFMSGFDRQGYPVCYNALGELFGKNFDDDERANFLRWLVKFMEKNVRQQLEFAPGGIGNKVQVTDLKDLPGLLGKEFHLLIKEIHLLIENYPDLVAKQQIVINVPPWYMAWTTACNTLSRSKTKFVYAAPSKSAETLFRYIAPEQVPVKYGGFNRDDPDSEFSTADAVSEVIIKARSCRTIKILVSEVCTLVWELRVLGCGVSYGADFVPNAEDYTIVVEKTRWIAPAVGRIMSNSFKIGEPGKVVFKINNFTSKKKKLLYRSKMKLN